MKKLEWLNGDREIIESGHKTWDRQANVVSTGNIIANGFFGWHVRAYTEIECNGFTRPEGHLQEFDLGAGVFDRMPQHIKNRIRHTARERSVWVYSMHHWATHRHKGTWTRYKYEDVRVSHGYIVAAHNHDYLWSVVVGPTWKSALVVNFCIEVVTNNHPQNPVHSWTNSLDVKQEA